MFRVSCSFSASTIHGIAFVTAFRYSHHLCLLDCPLTNMGFTLASRFNSIVEDVASITNETGGTKKNLMNLLLYYFSKEIRMPLDKLTSEEKDMLMSIFERSGRYKT